MKMGDCLVESAKRTSFVVLCASVLLGKSTCKQRAVRQMITCTMSAQTGT